MFSNRKTFFLLLFPFLFTGCAGFPTQPPSSPETINHYLAWSERKAQLKHLQHWQAGGNFAVHSKQKLGVNASFSWQQAEPNYQFHLLGPFGSPSLLLKGNAQHVSLITSQKNYQAATAEKLLQQQLGLRLPVSQLRYWLRGLPAPQTRYTANLDAYNRLLKLRQSGWQVNYLHYTNRGKIDLPDHLLLSYQHWQIKLMITNWDLT